MTHFLLKNKRNLLILLVIVLLFVIVSPKGVRSATYTNHSISTNPTHSQPGVTVTLLGSGFAPSFSTKIFWDGSETNTFNTDSSGDFSISYNIPNGASVGGHTIRVCQYCGGGEFELLAETSFTIDPPPTAIPPTATNTPRPTRTPTPTPTTPACYDQIVYLSPDSFVRLGGDAGLDSTDVVIEVLYSHSAPMELTFQLNRDDHYLTSWPEPAPGTVVEHTTDPENPIRHIFTLRDVPLYFGYNIFQTNLSEVCNSREGPRTYRQFYNGNLSRGRIRSAACGDLGLGDDAEVIAFENSNPNYFTHLEEELGISFGGSIKTEEITDILTRSGRRAGASLVSMEFGSADDDILMYFDRPVKALGMYVGAEEVPYATSNIIAHLKVYGYPTGSDSFGLLGTASTTFPGEPTDILECLAFTGAEGDLISFASLTYLAEGTNDILAEQRVIDDLTFVFHEEGITLPEDNPPIVEITLPEEGGVFLDPRVGIRANIEEDRRLVHMWYQINTGELQDLGFLPSDRDDPTQYLAIANLVSGFSTAGTTNTFTVIAEDSAGQQGSDSVILTFATPVPELDLSIYAYEKTQVTQCLEDPGCGPDNSIPLFSGKPTILRVYIQATGASGSINDIGGELCIDGFPCFPSINRANIAQVDNPVESYRGDLDGTLNFLIPSSFTDNPQHLEMTVHINRDEEILEFSYTNNYRNLNMDIVASNPIRIITIGLRSHEISPDLAAARAEIYPYLETLYPSTNIIKMTFGGDALIDKTFAFDDLGDIGGCGAGWNGLIATLWFKMAFNHWGEGGTYWYAIVDEEVPHYNESEEISRNGCGHQPGYVAGGMVDTKGNQYEDYSGPIFAHELGHNLGLSHYPGCGAGGSDSRVPYNMRVYAELTEENPAPMVIANITDSWGVDLLRSEYPWNLYGPQSTDIMGYCGGEGENIDGVYRGRAWVSYYTYKNLIRAFYGDITSSTGGSKMLLSLLAQEVNPEYVVGVVSIMNDSVTLEQGFYTMDLALEQLEQMIPLEEQSTYLVELLDQVGETVISRYLDIENLGGGEYDPLNGLMMITLPWHSTIQSIRISRDGNLIYQKNVSPGMPEITLLTPNGGEKWPETGIERIKWEASDPDVDLLKFQVQYSVDNGETWYSLGTELSENYFDLEVDRLAGSEHVKIRVTASDGLNTIFDESDAVFSIPSKLPEVTIIKPLNNQSYLNGAGVILEAIGMDFEDREIPDSAFNWRSNIDGEIGTGPAIWGLSLSAGEHVITITITDSDGNETKQSVNIHIEEEPLEKSSQEIDLDNEKPTGPQLGNQNLFLIFGVIVLLSALGFYGLWYFLVKRPRMKK